ncbi:MAG: HAD family hydrolase [Deltaproteobacteria bacterium]
MQRAILFDLGGVLLSPHPERAIAAVARRAGRAADGLARALLGVTKLGLDAGRISPEEFAVEVSRAAGVPLSFPEVRSIWCDIFDDLVSMQELAAQLAERYPCYLLSNTDPMHFAHALARIPALGTFQGHHLSYEIGHLKPESEYYRAAFRRFGLAPQRCILIDDLRANVEAIVREGATGIIHESFEGTRDQLVALGVCA